MHSIHTQLRHRQQGSSRGWLIALIAVVVIGALVLWSLKGPGPTDFATGPTVDLAAYQAGNPTGVPPSLAGESAVKRGEYLARAADCLVCHTAHGGAPYAGGVGFALPFGTLYSTNITPDRDSGIGAYSDEEFLAAVRRGVRRDGTRLYPAMPYAAYTYMTDADALAIKAYLFSLAPVSAPARANTLGFPYNQRWLMAFWSGLFNANQRFRPNPQQSPEWNRGAYLAEALAHCGECHTPRNLAYALDGRHKFAGAVTGGWHAYNITAAPAAGIGAWSDEDVLAYLQHGHAAGHGTAAGPMGEAVDESFSRLDPADLQALVTYLRSVPAISTPAFAAQLAGPASLSHRDGPSGDALGKQIYEGACASCHGWSGESPVSGFATLTGARAVNDPHATNVVQVVIAGVDRSTPEGILPMPAFGESYSDTEIAAVANYVTARFGSTPSALSAHDVADLRRQSAE